MGRTPEVVRAVHLPGQARPTKWRLSRQEAFNLGDGELRMVDPGEMSRIGNTDETQVRVLGGDRFSRFRLQEGIPFTPKEQRRHAQLLPSFPEEQAAPETSGVTQAAQNTEVALEVAALTRDRCIEQRVCDSLRMHHEHLPPECAVPVSAWIRHQEPSESLPDDRQAEQP